MTTAATGAIRWIATLEQSQGLDWARAQVTQLIDSVPARTRDVLAGDWLGHPLHPMLTDLPIGFWTSAWVLDIVGGRRTQRVAAAMVGLGVAAAIPTLAAGLVDWKQLDQNKQRVGVVHMAANVLATATYTASFVARCRGRRLAGVSLGSAGAAVATVGGYLGGHLAFGPTDPMSSQTPPLTGGPLRPAGPLV